VTTTPLAASSSSAAEATASLSALVAETDSLSEDQQQLDIANDSQKVEDETPQLPPIDDKATDDNKDIDRVIRDDTKDTDAAVEVAVSEEADVIRDDTKDTDAAVEVAVSEEADVNVDDGRRGDEEQQTPEPTPTEDTEPLTLTPSDDKSASSDKIDDRIPPDDSVTVEEMIDEVATPTAAEDEISDESVQPKPDLKYQYSEGWCDSVCVSA